MSNTPWTREHAIHICVMIEAICPPFGCHVALTGGCLYKIGERKDLDLVFYRIRQVDSIDIDGLFGALATLGIHKSGGFGFVYKATYDGRSIDLFFPEEMAKCNETKSAAAVAAGY